MRLSRLLLSLACALPSSALAAPIINEIMFHPGGVPEDVRKEWVEIYNPDATPTDLTGWAFTKGVTYAFPNGALIPAGGYLVVAADVAAFHAAYPDFAGTVVGGWTGKLSNSGEQIQIDDVTGKKVCDVTYADDGDWGLRARGELSFTHRGWAWVSEADGTGKSLELRNRALTLESGQNWGPSLSAGGTPGAVNSIETTNVAPLVLKAKHRPAIPHDNEDVVVSCQLADEASGATAKLRWRIDGAATFEEKAMTDADGDGNVEATIPAQANLKVVEWYIEATDGTLSRTWPAPARTSNPGVAPETFGQVANALYQVDNSYSAALTFRTPADSPLYRLIMTEAERAELAQIGNSASAADDDSEAKMNGTFISHDGTGLKVIYQCGFRNRGQASASGPPNNFHVTFPSADLWNGRASFGLNCQFPISQALGAALHQRAGLPAQDTAIVRVRVNGADLATTGLNGTALMFGRYARVEGRGADWAAHHYPLDPDGNFYRLDDHAYPQNDTRSGEFRWEGPLVSSYSDTFFKESNEELNDYSDLMEFARVVSAPATGGTAEQPALTDAQYLTEVAKHLDLDEFYRFIATDALIGNREGGLQSGRADDVSIYRGVIDQRFRFVMHDMDDVFSIGIGVGDGATRSIFSYVGQAPTSATTGVDGFARLFSHPQLVPRYYTAVLQALDTWYKRATIDPIIDQIMAGWVADTDGTADGSNHGIAEIKAFVDTRRANVLAQIQQNFALTVTTAGADTTEGYKLTTTGAATFAGTFNVAKTYSVTVNGVLAQWFYRPSGQDAAGTWKLAVPAGGGGILAPGLNKVVVRFWGSPGGTGEVVQELTANVFYNTGAETTVSGTLAPPGTLSLEMPATYVPGVPILVRVDQKDAAGALNRGAWNTTVNLTGTNGVTLTPSTVTLYNGMGSALVAIGSGGGGTVPIFTTGTGGTGSATATTGTPGSTWKALVNLTTATIANVPATWKDEGFDDSTWVSLPTQTGYSGADEHDENRAFTRTDYDPATAGTQSAPSYLFRNTFTLDNFAQIASVTGAITYDDGYAIYVNGAVVARSSNLPTGKLLTDYTNGDSPTDNTIANFTIPLANLKPGLNTIAVEIHQGDNGSSDVSFGLRMQANLSAANPGNFTLNASGGGLGASKALTSLAGTSETTASGVLPAGVTNWSGIVRVTGDVNVPSGATLNIAAGTHVLMAGTVAAGDAGGSGIIVNGGTLAVNGTAAQPVSMTSSDPTARWGQIFLNGAQPTQCNFLLMSRGGHSPVQGHGQKGPMWRLSGSSLNFEDSAMGDGPAKALYVTGTCDFNMRRSLMARMITGPEFEDGSAILIEDSNIQEILPHYREGAMERPDDEDCLYIQNPSARPVLVRRVVFARCGDDVFDCLAGPITVEDSILREGWDKGMSLLNNDLTIKRTLIIDCDKGIVPKSRDPVTHTVIADRCTIVAQNHDTTKAPWGYALDPSAPDADSPSTGLYTQNKAGQSNAGATLDITATNCIILGDSPVLVDAPYLPEKTVVTYSITRDTDTPATAAWPGTGNSNADPLFVSLAGDDFRLASGSPAINAGDPAATDPDGSRADMGALPSGTISGGGPASEVVWSLAGSPYHVTANMTVPANLTLRISPGVSVYFSKNARLTVNGRILAEGTEGHRIVFSHVPGTVDPGDADPIKNGTQTGPSKWGGIRVYDSLTQESRVRYCDFINAQGTAPTAPENFGSIGFVRSWGWVDHCTWAGTHLRMCYGRNSKMTVTHSVFPDMFIFDPLLTPPDNPPTVGRIEDPTDFLTAADNNMEPLKVEYPTTDAEVTGANAANFPNGQPFGGFWRVYYNDFHGNRGHQDVSDLDSGRWGQTGQFMLDCRYNYYHGLGGDEHIDLGGDAYIASNIFEHATKDKWVSAFGTDLGYSNAISSGDKGTGTTIMVVRNIFFDLDHAINCKENTATIFEHNTVANFHADYLYTPSDPDQNVKCAPINFFVPEDGANPTRGDGAYVGFNLISNVPRVFSGADTRKVDGTTLVNDVTTKIEFNYNLLDQLGTTDIGANHPGGVFGGTYGPNTPGAPGFIDPVNKNYGIRPDSLARGTTPFGFNYGASIAEWAYIVGGPAEGGFTAATTAAFTIGGPGIVAYKWRLDGGAWSASIQIGAGGVLPRTGPTIRQATLTLPNLAAGPHTLEVLGQDMAGNWQDDDPARTIEGLPQAAPTQRTWTVNTAFVAARLSEIYGDSVELQNLSGAPADLAGWFLTDDPAVHDKVPLTGTIATAGFSQHTGLLLDHDGDAVYLFQGATLRDSVVFGAQVGNKSLSRHPVTGAWTLGNPTLGAANTAIPVGDFSSVQLSEWLASGKVLYSEDWIELHNTSTQPVLLSGLRITDNRPGDPNPYTFPPLSFLGAGGYLRLVADASAKPGHLPFKLDSEQQEIALLRADGSLLDVIAFYPQTTDYSMGRNDTGAYTFYELPTRGLPNGVADPAYANALAILHGLRITEIMFNALGGPDYDYVELRNVGAVPFEIGGVSFVTGISYTFAARVLQPGDYVVVAKNPAKYANRYGTTTPVVGPFLGQLDNGGETLGLQLPPPFDANVLTFAYKDTWVPGSDGDGLALVVTAPGTTPASEWDERETWAPSVVGGSPAGATARTDTYAGWSTLHHALTPTQDDDHDGVPILVEFGLGLNPASGLGLDGPLGLPQPALSPDAHAQLTFLVPLNPAAVQSHGFADAIYTVEASDNLLDWTPIAVKTFTTNWTGAVTTGDPANGYLPVIVTDLAVSSTPPVPADPGDPKGVPRFLHLKIEWAP